MESKNDINGLSAHFSDQILTLNRSAIVSITDRNGVITYVNDYFVEISGFSKIELIGQNHRLLKSGLQNDLVFQELWSVISNNRIWKGEIVNKKKNGEYYWVDTTIVPFTDEQGNIEKYVSIRFDITAQKKKEFEIVDDKSRITQLNNKIIESMDELFYILEMRNSGTFNNPITYVTPQVNIVMGLFEEELLTMQNRWQDLIHPDDLTKVNDAMYDMVLSQKPIMICYRVLNKILDEYRWVEEYACPSVNAQGVMVEVYGSVKDISARMIDMEKLKHEKMKLLISQHQLLCSQLNPHFIFNTMNSLQFYILNGQVVESLEYMSRFSALMRLVLENSSKKYITLADEISFINEYIAISKIRIKSELKVEVTTSKKISIKHELIPPMLIQPYVENTFVHAFPLLRELPELTIHFNKVDQRIICTITDNGVGRNCCGETNEIKSKKSYAMTINQKRVEIMNQFGEHNFKIEVKDLKNEFGEPSGTRVSISYDAIENTNFA